MNLTLPRILRIFAFSLPCILIIDTAIAPPIRVTIPVVAAEFAALYRTAVIYYFAGLLGWIFFWLAMARIVESLEYMSSAAREKSNSDWPVAD